VRNDKDPVEKTRLTNVGNPAVNDNACIENLIGLLRRPLAAEDSAKSREIQEIALVRTDDQPDVCH
jgi:hypothetical protein